MKQRKGIKELGRSTKGNSYIAVGKVTDYKKVGCPKCDTLYLQLFRDGEEVLFLAMTPEESQIISDFLYPNFQIGSAQ